MAPVVEVPDGVSKTASGEMLQGPDEVTGFGTLSEDMAPAKTPLDLADNDTDLIGEGVDPGDDHAGLVDEARVKVADAYEQPTEEPAVDGFGDDGKDNAEPPTGGNGGNENNRGDGEEGDDEDDLPEVFDEKLIGDVEESEIEVELRREEDRLTQEELTARKERDVELVRRWKEGDDQAAAELIGHYERFISMKAGRSYRRFDTRLTIEDVAQEGRLGFLRAAKRWDSEQGQLLSYGSIAAERHMLRALREDSFQVHIPEHIGKTVQKIRALNNTRLEEGKPQLSDQQIVEEFGLPLRAHGHNRVSVESIRRADMLTRLVVSLDSSFAPNLTDHVSGAEARVNTDLAKPMLNLAGENPLDHADDSTDRVMLETLLDRVTNWGTEDWEKQSNARDMQIIRMLTGTDGTGDVKTQAEIARELGMSPQLVSQRVNRAINKLLYHSSRLGITRQ
jgi:RNA polymerase sigma factor (sigma-70 family)